MYKMKLAQKNVELSFILCVPSFILKMYLIPNWSTHKIRNALRTFLIAQHAVVSVPEMNV